MNKKVFGKKLSRERSSREALFVGLVSDLVLNKKIETTKAKAKAIVGMIDKMVVLAKKNTLGSKRELLRKLKGNKDVATLLWKEIASVFTDRNSGFTKMVNLPQRKGDLSEMVRLEWAKDVVKKDEKNISTKEK